MLSSTFFILSLWMLWAASKLVGDKQREVEFMMRARHHLEYLFDSTHMEVAEGLMCMAYYSLSQVEWDIKQLLFLSSILLVNLHGLSRGYFASHVLHLHLGWIYTIFVLHHLGKEHPEKTQCIRIRYTCCAQGQRNITHTHTHTHTYTHKSLTSALASLYVCLVGGLFGCLQLSIQECCIVAFWIPTLPLKKNNPFFTNTTSILQVTPLVSLTPHRVSSNKQTNRNVNLCPRVDTHRSYRLAHTPTPDMDQADSYQTGVNSIAKLLTTCHVMVAMKKSTSSPLPSAGRSLTQRDESFFSSLAAAIKLLEQLTHEWGM